MAVTGLISFSCEGEYLAHCSPDGRLRIWEISTGFLTKEYTPSSHLSATCSCLSWSSTRHNTVIKNFQRFTDYKTWEKVIAMGTMAGSILLYSVPKGRPVCQLTEGHTSKVNAVCWSSNQNTLYSCSSDGQIIEWYLKSGTVNRKWMGSERGVTSICLSPNEKCLMSASRKIKCWNLEDLSVNNVFTGHETPVNQLLTIVSYKSSSGTSNESYVLSLAEGDTMVNAWHFTGDKPKNEQAIASFLLPGEAVSMTLNTRNSKNPKSQLAVLTKCGSVHIFQHTLNGKCAKPIKPTVVISVEDEDGKNKKKKRPLIPLAGVSFSKEVDAGVQLVLAYGSFVQMRFETMPFSTQEKNVVLKRSDPSKTVTKVETYSKNKTPLKANTVKLLAPVLMVPSVTPKHKVPDSHLMPDHVPVRKKRKISEPNAAPTDETMEERLKSVRLSGPSRSTLPQIENLSQLLVQGLQCRDESITNKVLNRDDTEIIAATVPLLPIGAIVPLVKELYSKIHSYNGINQTYLKWLRCVMSVHTSYIMAYPDLDVLLGKIYQVLDTRGSVFEKVMRLRGRMDFILAQITVNRDPYQLGSTAGLDHHNDSSDEGEGLDDLHYSHSESEADFWDDFSEADSEDSEAKTNSEDGEENADEDVDEDVDNEGEDNWPLQKANGYGEVDKYLDHRSESGESDHEDGDDEENVEMKGNEDGEDNESEDGESEDGESEDGENEDGENEDSESEDSESKEDASDDGSE